jgi:hypothetical protein
MRAYVSLIYLGLVIWMVVGVWRVSRRRSRPGSAMTASMDMLFDDTRRAAIQVIVEERTGERDPEDKDGNLPDLAGAATTRPSAPDRGSSAPPSPDSPAASRSTVPARAPW